MQKQGVAVGWPLNLGHDTTGWSLGLRLRLMQEDLQWPRMPELALSSSTLSTDSSSLDSISTRSFDFQDRSKSLGSLIGHPILDADGSPIRFGQQPSQQQQLQQAFQSPSPLGPNTTAAGHQAPLETVRNTLRSRGKARRLHHHRSSAHPHPQHHHQRHLPTSSPARRASSAASSTGWSLLSALSCAHVPASIGTGAKEDDEETSTPRAQWVAREEPPRSSAQDLESTPQESSNEKTHTPLLLRRTNLSPQHVDPLARKLYDNITFEDEELQTPNMQRRRTSGMLPGASSELNPLFASSPCAAAGPLDQTEPRDGGQRAGARTTPDQFAGRRAYGAGAASLMTVVGRSTDEPDTLLYCRQGSSLRNGRSAAALTFSVDVGKWQQKQLGHTKSKMDKESESVSHEIEESSKSRAVSAFIYRMVCYRCTRIKGSSF